VVAASPAALSCWVLIESLEVTFVSRSPVLPRSVDHKRVVSDRKTSYKQIPGETKWEGINKTVIQLKDSPWQSYISEGGVKISRSPRTSLVSEGDRCIWEVAMADTQAQIRRVYAPQEANRRRRLRDMTEFGEYQLVYVETAIRLRVLFLFAQQN
jgi:hypothetical protein